MDFDPLSSGGSVIIRRPNSREEGSETKGRNVGKKLRMCSGRRGIRKWGQEPLGVREMVQKNFGIFFKSRGRVIHGMCRSGDWYILLRNVGKMSGGMILAPPC